MIQHDARCDVLPAEEWTRAWLDCGANHTHLLVNWTAVGHAAAPQSRRGRGLQRVERDMLRHSRKERSPAPHVAGTSHQGPRGPRASSVGAPRVEQRHLSVSLLNLNQCPVDRTLLAHHRQLSDRARSACGEKYEFGSIDQSQERPTTELLSQFQTFLRACAHPYAHDTCVHTNAVVTKPRHA